VLRAERASPRRVKGNDRSNAEGRLAGPAPLRAEVQAGTCRTQLDSATAPGTDVA
jgi:hypothetical protein